MRALAHAPVAKGPDNELLASGQGVVRDGAATISEFAANKSTIAPQLPRLVSGPDWLQGPELDPNLPVTNVCNPAIRIATHAKCRKEHLCHSII